MDALAKGKDVGFMSEAGCPGVADPGAIFTAYAHHIGARVRPLTGPSSILLAIMGSGLIAPRFTFHEYLPRDKNALRQTLRKLEKESASRSIIQVFIETPYRNDQVMEACLDTLAPGTSLSVAADLTAPTEQILTLPVSEWKKRPGLALHKRPAIFSFLAY